MPKVQEKYLIFVLELNSSFVFIPNPEECAQYAASFHFEQYEQVREHLIGMACIGMRKTNSNCCMHQVMLHHWQVHESLDTVTSWLHQFAREFYNTCYLHRLERPIPLPALYLLSIVEHLKLLK